LQLLSLASCGLTSLDNFPKLPNLEELSLEANKLPGSALKNLAHLTNLKVLNVVANNIKDINDFKALAKIEIEQIELLENDAANKEGYRKALFDIIKTLQIVDMEDREGKEVAEEDFDDGGDLGEEDYDDEDEDGGYEDEGTTPLCK
jgi:Leucine-rich repeat (LRR) protein